MLLRSFAHWLLWLIAGGLLLLGLFFAAEFGLFGTSLQNALDDLTEPIIRIAIANSDLLISIGKATAALFTAFTGVLGLLRAWHYAEKQLPYRLEDYINRKRSETIVANRHSLLATVSAPQDLNNYLKSEPSDDPLRAEVSTTLKVLEAAVASWRKQGATLDYVAARRKSLLADRLLIEGRERDAHKLRDEAVTHLLKAGEADSDDLSAWEEAAEQAEKMFAFDKACQAWMRLGSACEERQDFLGQATAYFRQGRACLRRSKDVSLSLMERRGIRRSARDCLEDARQLIQGLAGPEPARTRLLAQICEALGEVRLALGTIPTAQDRLNDARHLYVQLGDQEGIDRVDLLLDELQDD